MPIIISRAISLTLINWLLFLITGLSAHQVQAQNISYGLKGGINLANHYDAQFDADPITKMRIGAYVNVGLGSSPFAFQPEVYFFQNGSQSSYQFIDIVFRGNFRTKLYQSADLISIHIRHAKGTSGETIYRTIRFIFAQFKVLWTTS
jgi:hypothetical protein